ncbi:MAG: 30S ribosomal protein S17 [Candidatus Woykebacteria bacterium RBG_13_40_15]|uniref:Small ribosomal subunit protein uS17 n=1 Tax=Candidatus Woykebacteria bacterium RBG_13_40_15 TaxID=1802593 RepID=A0A1G1W928_9BACT|nr:MAG: 30S ribosomal protein S17 [Candidatus Woykebacteria bacterium RBG_13_40_15]
MDFIGRVTSINMQKTAMVEIERFVTHPLYKKRIRRSSKFKVHDEIGVKPGDKVKIATTRPISKDKHFRIVEVIK